MTVVESSRRPAALEHIRRAMGELFGAERRLRGREQSGPQDVTFSQLRALVVLEQTEEATVGDLAKSAELNPASVTVMLDQLEANGIVQRRRDAADRRVCMVSLTERGRTIVEDKRTRLHALWNDRLGELSDDELAVASKVLGVMTQVLEEL